MALSGTLYTNVNSYWRLQLEWSATQNIGANTSTVTTELFWMGVNGRGATYSSATKSGSITLDGTASSFSGGGLGKLYNGQKKLIHSSSKTIAHDSDGTKSFNLSAYFDVELSLNGSYYGRVTVSGSGTLNTIPRASSLTSSASWTAGGNRSISISRASGSFTHTARLYVNGSLIKTITGIGNSTTASFSLAENTAIFNQLATKASEDTRIDLLTYNGGTLIGTKSYTGTVTAPSSSTTSWSGNFNIRDTITGTIKQSDSAFTHTIQLIFTGTTYTLFTRTASTSWSYDTAAIAASLFAKMPAVDTLIGKIRIYTYYNGSQVRSFNESNIYAYAKKSKPQFSDSYVTYKDTNAATVAITGNNQYIIQQLSTLAVTLTSGAIATDGASISRYEVTVNGVLASMTAIGTTSFANIQSEKNITLKVKVIDSRGSFVEVSKTVTMIPYKSPVITPKVSRESGFDTRTTMFASGNLSLLPINGVNKNAISNVSFRFKAKTVSTYGSWINMSAALSGNNYNVTSVIVTMDNTKAFDVEFRVTDKFTTTTISKVVEVGRPIFFIDNVKNSIAFNDFPKDNGEFRFNGRLVFGANTWASNPDFFGALAMSNSDIVGVNGIYMNDISENAGEGINFLKTGRAEGSPTADDYDTLRVLDGDIYLDNTRIHMTSDRVLWSGGSFMSDTQTITPRIPLNDCPNGWILVWGRYFNSAVANSDFNYVYVPKNYYDYSGNSGFWNAIVAAGSADSVAPPVAHKYMYPRNTTMFGHARNRTGTESGQVLRYVLSY